MIMTSQYLLTVACAGVFSIGALTYTGLKNGLSAGLVRNRDYDG